MHLKVRGNELTERSKHKVVKAFEKAIKENKWKIVYSVGGLTMTDGEKLPDIFMLGCKKCYCCFFDYELEPRGAEFEIKDEFISDAVMNRLTLDEQFALAELEKVQQAQKKDVAGEIPDRATATVETLVNWLDSNKYSSKCNDVTSWINERIDALLCGEADYGVLDKSEKGRENKARLYYDMGIALLLDSEKSKYTIKSKKGEFVYVESEYAGVVLDEPSCGEVGTEMILIMPDKKLIESVRLYSSEGEPTINLLQYPFPSEYNMGGEYLIETLEIDKERK